MSTEAMAGLLNSLALMRDRMAEECRKLSEDPTTLAVLVVLMDALDKDLNYLCHFDWITSANGQQVDVGSVHTKLQQLFRESFTKLTGETYHPEICRQVDFRNKADESKTKEV